MTPLTYYWLSYLLAPLVWLWDIWRSFTQPIYRPFRAQRWARQLPQFPAHKNNGIVLWIHAVSVGETQACAPLLRQLLAQYADAVVLLTHMTPTGRNTGLQLFDALIAQGRVVQCYLPYDVPVLCHRFLAHFKPKLGVIMETEVWPNLIATCRQRNIPLGLANARLSERSLRKALRFEQLSKPTYSVFDWIAAQSERDAARFAQLSPKNISIVGNLKFEVSINEVQFKAGQAFQSELQLGGRSTLALASTREGEEALLLKVLLPWLKQNSAYTGQKRGEERPPLMLLIPRHPKRIDEILEVLKRFNLKFAQRSLGRLPTLDTDVYVGDTLGEMWFYYGASKTVVMGGGWLPHGGQNPLEPCLAGCATIVGPHMQHFETITQLALAQTAMVQCKSVSELIPSLETLSPEHNHAKLAKAGKAFVAQHTGAVTAHLQLLEKSLNGASKSDNTHAFCL